MKIKFNTPIKVFFVSGILLAILGILMANYLDRKEAERKAEESKNSLLYGSSKSEEDNKEQKALESKNSLLYGSKSEN